MLLNFIKLGIKTLLRNICEKITIQSIEIINNYKNFSKEIYKLNIKAENIIFNKINIRKLNINAEDLILKLEFKKNPLIIEGLNAEITIQLTTDNINKTLFNKKWNGLKLTIESFLLNENISHIDIKNNLIYFISKNRNRIDNSGCYLKFYKSRILLVKNDNNKELPIFMDENIKIKKLQIIKNNIELHLNSKIAFNS